MGNSFRFLWTCVVHRCLCNPVCELRSVLWLRNVERCGRLLHYMEDVIGTLVKIQTKTIALQALTTCTPHHSSPHPNMDRSLLVQALASAVCMTPGCGKPTFNGKPGGKCVKSCGAAPRPCKLTVAVYQAPSGTWRFGLGVFRW